MVKTTLKQIKELAVALSAIDLSPYDFDECRILTNRVYPIMYSVGTYGINGAVWRDKDDKYYYTTKRGSALFMLM